MRLADKMQARIRNMSLAVENEILDSMDFDLEEEPLAYSLTNQVADNPAMIDTSVSPTDVMETNIVETREEEVKEKETQEANQLEGMMLDGLNQPPQGTQQGVPSSNLPPMAGSPQQGTSTLAGMVAGKSPLESMVG